MQKIAQDEYETHCALDFMVIQHEMTTERGQIAYEQLRPRMNRVLNEVIETELNWSDFVMTDDETGEIVEDLNTAPLKQLKDSVLPGYLHSPVVSFDMEYRKSKTCLFTT